MLAVVNRRFIYMGLVNKFVLVIFFIKRAQDSSFVLVYNFYAAAVTTKLSTTYAYVCIHIFISRKNFYRMNFHASFGKKGGRKLVILGTLN